MLQDQFYHRLLLLIAVGVVYIKAYMNMAKRNSKETEPERHITIKILGGFWAIMGIIMGVMGVYLITQISFPQEAIGPYISPNMIVRPSHQTMYWGHATMAQSQCISLISGVFESFALSAYCFLFKSSHSKWYTKIGKVVFCVLFFMFYASATDFHYFDLYEWTAPALFAIMAFFAFRENKKEIINDIPNAGSHDITESVTTSETKEDNSRFMPCMSTEVDIVQDNIKENVKDDSNSMFIEQTDIKSVPCEENSTSEISEKEPLTNSDSPSEQENVYPIRDQTIKFCRHCGRQIDYISDKYCKYCGKSLL